MLTKRLSRALPQALPGTASDRSEMPRNRRRALDFRALLRPSVRTPPATARRQSKADALLAFFPSKAYQLSSRAEALPSRAFAPSRDPAVPKNSRFTQPRAAPQGLEPPSLATTPKSRRSPHEVSDLIRLRSNLRYTPANQRLYRLTASTPEGANPASARMSQVVTMDR